MDRQRRKYQAPTLTKVKFEDKELVAFKVCRKQTATESDSASCCSVLPFGTPNLDTFDPS